jgi:hypothetical protein
MTESAGNDDAFAWAVGMRSLIEAESIPLGEPVGPRWSGAFSGAPRHPGTDVEMIRHDVMGRLAELLRIAPGYATATGAEVGLDVAKLLDAGGDMGSMGPAAAGITWPYEMFDFSHVPITPPSWTDRLQPRRRRVCTCASGLCETGHVAAVSHSDSWSVAPNINRFISMERG